PLVFPRSLTAPCASAQEAGPGRVDTSGSAARRHGAPRETPAGARGRAAVSNGFRALLRDRGPRSPVRARRSAAPTPSPRPQVPTKRGSTSKERGPPWRTTVVGARPAG